jgi:hypothetical protein
VSYAKKTADEKKKIRRSPTLRKSQRNWNGGLEGVAAVIS